jgi:hypothetical protein
MNPTRLDLIRSTSINGERKDLSIAIGEDWELNFTVTDSAGAAVDITGWTFLSEIKTAADVDVATIVGAVVSGPAGTFKLTLAKAVTELLTASDDLCWDAFRIDGGLYSLLLYGNANVKATKTDV